MKRPQPATRAHNVPWRTLFPAWFLRLYRQPVAFVAVVLVVPLATVFLWLYLVNEHQWRARESRDLATAARLAARITQEQFTRTRQIEEALAARPAFVQAIKHVDRLELERQLQLLLDVSPMIDHVLVTNAEAKILAQVPPVRPDETTTLVLALTPSNPHPIYQPVSGVFLGDDATGQKAVAVSALVRDGETTLGTVQVQFRLEQISQWLEKVRIEPSGFLYIVDQHDRLVSYPFQILPGQPKDVSDWAPVALAGTPVGEVIRFTQGDPRHPWTAAVVSLSPFGWRVIAQQPDHAMLAPFHNLVWSFVLLILALGGIVSLLVFRWVKLHRTTLRLVAEQARLLRTSEQHRLISMLRRPGGSPR